MAGLEATTNGVSLDTRRRLLQDTLPEDNIISEDDEILVSEGLESLTEEAATSVASAQLDSVLDTIVTLIYPYADNSTLQEIMGRLGYQLKTYEITSIAQRHSREAKKIDHNRLYGRQVALTYLSPELRRIGDLIKINIALHNERGVPEGSYYEDAIPGPILVMYMVQNLLQNHKDDKVKQAGKRLFEHAATKWREYRMPE